MRTENNALNNVGWQRGAHGCGVCCAAQALACNVPTAWRLTEPLLLHGQQVGETSRAVPETSLRRVVTHQTRLQAGFHGLMV